MQATDLITVVDNTAWVLLRPVREVNARLAAWHISYIDLRKDTRRKYADAPKLGLLYALQRPFGAQAGLYVRYLEQFWVSYPLDCWTDIEQEFEHRSKLIEAFFGNIALDSARCSELVAGIIQEQSAVRARAAKANVLIDQPDPDSGIFSKIKQEIELLVSSPPMAEMDSYEGGDRTKAPHASKQAMLLQAYLRTSMPLASHKVSNPAVSAGLQVFILGMADMLRQAESLDWDQFITLYEATLSEYDLLPSMPIKAFVENVGRIASSNRDVEKVIKYGAQSIRMYAVERDANAPTDLVSAVLFFEKNAPSFTDLSG